MLRQDFDDVLRRNIDITSSDVKKGVLIHVISIGELQLPDVKPLEDWKLPEQYKEYLDACIAKYKAFWQQRPNLDDDLLPSMKPFFGIAEHSAFVGGKVVYGGDTSYHEPPVDSWDKLDNLQYSEDNENFKMLMDSLRYMKEHSAIDGFLPTLRGLEAPMDMANAMRGNDLFTDFYDEEEKVHKLIHFCLEAGKWSLSHQMEIIGQVSGGVMSGIGIWLPGKSVGHISEDASCMCSADMYQTFGKPYTQRLLEGYDSAIFHTHTMGRHILPDICSIPQISFIQLTYDPNQPSPIDVFREYENVLKNKVVLLTMKLDEIKNNLDFLKEHKSIVQFDAATMDEAQEAVSLIKSIRAN